MFDKEFWVTDIFSYLPAQQISLDDIKNILRKHMDGGIDPVFEILVDPEKLQLSEPQLFAVSELENEKRHIAYLCRDQKVVAIIGYADR